MLLIQTLLIKPRLSLFVYRKQFGVGHFLCADLFPATDPTVEELEKIRATGLIQSLEDREYSLAIRCHDSVAGHRDVLQQFGREVSVVSEKFFLKLCVGDTGN